MKRQLEQFRQSPWLKCFFLLALSALPSLSLGNIHPSLIGNRRWDCNDDLVAGCINSKLFVWNLHNGKLLAEIDTGVKYIRTVRLTPDGKDVMSCSWVDGGVVLARDRTTNTTLWSISSGKPKYVLPKQVFSSFSRDGKSMLCFSEKGSPSAGFSLSNFDLKNGRRKFETPLEIYQTPSFTTTKFSSRGDFFVITDSRRAAVFSSRSGKLCWKTETLNLEEALFTPNDRLLLVFPDKVEFADYLPTEQKGAIPTKAGPSPGPESASHSGPIVCIVNSTRSYTRIDLSTGKAAYFESGTSALKSMFFSEAADRFVTASYRNEFTSSYLLFFSMKTGKLVLSLDLDEDSDPIGFTPNGDQFLILSPSRLRRIDLKTGKEGKPVRLKTG